MNPTRVDLDGAQAQLGFHAVSRSLRSKVSGSRRTCTYSRLPALIIRASISRRRVWNSAGNSHPASAAARLHLLPVRGPEDSCYSPYFHPIEDAFAKHKALLSRAAEPTTNGLEAAFGRIADTFMPAKFLGCRRPEPGPMEFRSGAWQDGPDKGRTG